MEREAVNPAGGVQNRLRSVRSRLGLSQQDLARAAGVTRQTVGGIEAGQFSPSAAVALRLARALGCPVEALFWLEDETQALEAVPVHAFPFGRPVRLAVGRVDGRWVAHSLDGDEAFRTETVPADGTGILERHDAATLQVKVLEDPATLARTVLLAGCTPVLSLWARAAERWHPGLRIHWTFANTSEALLSLARGEVHAAGLHASGQGMDNSVLLESAIPGEEFALVNLGEWEEGLLLPPGNPDSVRSVADLARPELLLANREPGAGCRMLLDDALAAEGIPPIRVPGYSSRHRGHLAVARAVASGAARVGVSSAAVAAIYGLDFLPLREVRYDLALRRATLDEEPVRQLLGTLEHRRVRAQFRLLGGYDTTRTGEVTCTGASS